MKPDPHGKLPIAVAALAFGLLDSERVKASDHLEEGLSHLDGIVEDARSQIQPGDANPEIVKNAIAYAIHDASGYQGDSDTYDDLSNANLFRVIERRKGLPVALGIIYMHVGRQLGLAVDGLAFPDHFLLRLESTEGRLIIDPFFGGITRDAASLRDLLKTIHGTEAELAPQHYSIVDDLSVLFRLQNNIKLRLLSAGKNQTAIEIIESMLILNGNDASLWREAGLLHADIGNIRAALSALSNFTDLSHDPLQRQKIEAFMNTLRHRLN